MSQDKKISPVKGKQKSFPTVQYLLMFLDPKSHFLKIRCCLVNLSHPVDSFECPASGYPNETCIQIMVATKLGRNIVYFLLNLKRSTLRK